MKRNRQTDGAGRRAPAVVRGLTLFPMAALLEDKLTLQWIPSRNATTNKWSGVPGKLAVSAVGKIALPTGRLVALDPLVGDTQAAVPGNIPPGRYPVLKSTLQIGDAKPVVAALTVRFTKRPTKTFRPGPFISVDSATVAFVDKSVHRTLFRMAPRDDPTPWYKKVWASEDGSLVLDKKTRANVVSSVAGYGDGTYRVWRGLDEEGTVVCALIDLGVVNLVEDVLGRGPADVAATILSHSLR